ncbi:MAG: nitroreductase family protein [Pseudonocardia sp.]
MRILAAASTGTTEDALLGAIPSLTSDHLDRLVEAGLLDEHPTTLSAPDTFTATYQRATYNYPFHDYSSPGWQKQEQEILDSYARLWPAPSAILARDGPLLQLPEIALSAVPHPQQHGQLTPELLGWVLKNTFGAIGEISTKYITCVRRTSPSGGARHPAEVGVVLPTPAGAIPTGTYRYDVARHGLVPDTQRTAGGTLAADWPARFVLRARVERAMWRYRDLRALRPVLLDIGHIAETIALLLGHAGLPTTLVSAPSTAIMEPASWEEPDMAMIVISDVKTARSVCLAGMPAVSEASDTVHRADSYLTNPTAVLGFANDGLTGRVVWPRTTSTKLDELDFRILNHCIPSTRGDRATEPGKVAEGIGTNVERVHTLADAGLLLPEDQAVRAFDAARLWVRHDWYLSLLAHLEALIDSQRQPVIGRIDGGVQYVPDLTILPHRRTSRAFQTSVLPARTMTDLLASAVPPSLVSSTAAPLRVFAAPLAVDGLASEVHEWRNGALTSLRTPVRRNQVQELTTGQAPAAGGSFTIWLVATVDTGRPASYQLAVIELGQLGQRFCLAATRAGLGVFCTPAVRDRETAAMLGVEDSPSFVAYLFSFGLPRR